MHTLEEAEGLWCPMIQNGGSNRPINSSNELVVVLNHCVGKKCMAWRWAQKPNPDWKPDNHMMQVFPRDTRNEPPMYIADETRGYCGMAGRP